MKTPVGPRNHVLDRGANPPRERGNFRGLPGPFKSIGNLRCTGRCRSAAKEIIQSPITSCSRRDHSVYQASSNSILKMSGRTAPRHFQNTICACLVSRRRRCGILAAKGVVELHSAGEVWYLRVPCCCTSLVAQLVALTLSILHV